SAGCASGEEAYTLALVLVKVFPVASPSILATDVSANALAIARRGVYPKASLERVPDAWRDGFVVDGMHARVRPDVARVVTFEQSNLAGRDRPAGFDLVWCRNVLIYFDAGARKRAIAKLINALKPGGFLFVGYSETLRDVGELEPRTWRDQVLYV